MIYKVDNGTVTIFLPKRIESTNSEEIRKQLDKCIEESGCDNIIFDSSDTEYISSAGLRVFMMIHKKHKSTKFINLTDNVKEIFDITGFINTFL